MGAGGALGATPPTSALTPSPPPNDSAGADFASAAPNPSFDTGVGVDDPPPDIAADPPQAAAEAKSVVNETAKNPRRMRSIVVLPRLLPLFAHENAAPLQTLHLFHFLGIHLFDRLLASLLTTRGAPPRSCIRGARPQRFPTPVPP